MLSKYESMCKSSLPRVRVTLIDGDVQEIVSHNVLTDSIAFNG